MEENLVKISFLGDIMCELPLLEFLNSSIEYNFN